MTHGKVGSHSASSISSATTTSLKNKQTNKRTSTENTNTMADPDIPIVFGTVVPILAPPGVSLDQQQQQQRQTSSFSFMNRSQPHADMEPLSPDTLSILCDQGYTRGLAEAMHRNKRAFALSIWIVDNSGSMQTRDGHKIIPQKGGGFSMTDCSRWSEMQQTVEYHTRMAALLQAPTVFRLLNDPGRLAGPRQFSIAQRGAQFVDEDLAVAQSTMMNTQPGGVTPLTHHIRDIRNEIMAMEQQLRNEGTKVAIILATDGLPTDMHGYCNDYVKQEFKEAMRSLEGLPVWVVVRLCTDEESVVQYWNDLDSQMEFNLETLDDFCSEAAEVHQHNSWFTYGLPLHRMREMGFYHRVFDTLDERKLAKDELREFMRILFGPGLIDEAPEPESDFKTFSEIVAQQVGHENKQWCSVHKKLMPWIDVKKLNKEYGHKGLFGLW